MGIVQVVAAAEARQVVADMNQRVMDDLGFITRRVGVWRRQDLEVRLVLDSKAQDPYRGGAMTFEFEVSDNGVFGKKLSGRAQLPTLIDAEQESRLLEVRNQLAAGMTPAPPEHLALVPEFLREDYLETFRPSGAMGRHFWLRYHQREDLVLWCRVLHEMWPVLVERAQRTPPTGFAESVRER